MTLGNAIQARQAVQALCGSVWSVASWPEQASCIAAMETSGAGETCMDTDCAMADCANSPKTMSMTTSSWRGDTAHMRVSVGEARKSSKKSGNPLSQGISLAGLT
jgi:hypothetical protein